MVKFSFARGFSALGLTALMALACGGQAARADTPTCDATTLNGNYSFNLVGSFYDSQGYSYVMALVGLSTFDGAGTLKGADTLSLDGFIHKRSITGTYSVNADCTGTISITGSDDITFVGNIVITETGKAMDFIDTDSDLIFSGVLKKQNPVTPSVSAVPPSE